MDKGKYDDLTDTYNDNPPGTLFRSGNEFFVKPAQSISHHMEGMLVNLFNGDLIHYSHSTTLTPVYGSQIMW